MIELVKKNNPRQYELTYLTSPSLEADKIKSIHDQVIALVKKHKGEVADTQDWSKKYLAYQIKKNGHKHHEAVYTHLVISILPTKINSFNQEFLLIEEILRHLLVLAEVEKKSGGDTSN